MNAIHSPPHLRPHSAVSDKTPGVLTDIYYGDVNMAIWQRHNDSKIAKECQALLHKDGRILSQLTLSLPRIKTLDEYLPGLSSCPHLLEDMLMLLDLFICLFEVNPVGLRLTSLV